MFAVARIVISIVAVGMNIVIVPVCFYAGLLSIEGSLSDTSDWENRTTGAQFLAVDGIALVNIIAILLLRKPLTRVARSTRCLLLGG